MTSARVGHRLERLERAILRRERIDRRQVEEDARQSLLAEVARLGQAYGIVPTGDPESLLRELDRASRKLDLRDGRRHR
jgi:hypothetical protein